MDANSARDELLAAQLRATDARLERLEAKARAREAKGEMDQIAGLRAQRDRVQRELADVKTSAQHGAESLRRRAEEHWNEFRSALADAHSRYSEWDAARERRFNARMDEADDWLKESRASDAEVAADVRLAAADARQNLERSVADAHRRYDDWRAKRDDRKAQRALDDAELALDEAYDRYAAARSAVWDRIPRERGD